MSAAMWCGRTPAGAHHLRYWLGRTASEGAVAKASAESGCQFGVMFPKDDSLALVVRQQSAGRREMPTVGLAWTS